MFDVDCLPGQRLDHREEAFGARSPLRKTSLTLRETASSVSSCLILRFEFQRLIRRLADSLTTINLLLVDSDINRCLRHPKRRRQLRDPRPGTSKLNDLTTHC